MRERRNSLGGHNTRNFGISTVAGAATTAQWNTLNGPHIPKANKVCYRLLHLRGYASGSIHALLRTTCYVENICMVSSSPFTYTDYLGKTLCELPPQISKTVASSRCGRVFRGNYPYRAGIAKSRILVGHNERSCVVRIALLDAGAATRYITLSRRRGLPGYDLRRNHLSDNQARLNAILRIFSLHRRSARRAKHRRSSR